MKFNASRRSSSLMTIALALLASAPLALADKYDGLTATFNGSMEVVHKAAVDALAVVGVDVKKDEPGFLEGKRHNKMGLVLGSGGEVLSVTLTAVDANKTEVKVRTTKTFVGRAGQKVWDQPVLDEISKALGETRQPASDNASKTPSK